MTLDVGAYVQTAAVLAYAAWLLSRAFGPRARFASWRMFAGVRHASFHLRRTSSPHTPFNPWDHLPHSDLKMSRGELDLFLNYVRRVHGVTDLEGQVLLRDGADVVRAEVGNSRVLG